MNDFETELHEFLECLGVNIQISELALNALNKFRQLSLATKKKEKSVWLACWAYISIIDTRFAYGLLDSQIMSMDPMPSSVSAILQAANCTLECFLSKMTQLKEASLLSASVQQHLHGVRGQHSCLLLFHSLHRYCEEIFKISGEQVNERRDACWCIFMHTKEFDLDSSQLSNFLLCCLGVTIQTSISSQLRPPYDSLKTCVDNHNLILKQLCTTHQADLDTVAELYDRYFSNHGLPFHQNSFNLEEMAEGYKRRHLLRGDINELDVMQHCPYLSPHDQPEADELEDTWSRDDDGATDNIYDTDAKGDNIVNYAIDTGDKHDGAGCDQSSALDEDGGGGDVCVRKNMPAAASSPNEYDTALRELATVYDMSSSCPSHQLLAYLKEYNISWQRDLEEKLNKMQGLFTASLNHAPRQLDQSAGENSIEKNSPTPIGQLDSPSYSSVLSSTNATSLTTTSLTSKQCSLLFNMAVSVFVDSLTSLILMERGRASSEEMTALLRHTTFHMCLFACALEVVLFVTLPHRDVLKPPPPATTEDHTTSFPWVVHLFGLKSFDLFRVISNFIRSKPVMPQHISNHMRAIEAYIVSCLAWKSDSPLLQVFSPAKTPSVLSFRISPSFKNNGQCSPRRLKSVSSFFTRVRQQGSQLIRKLAIPLQLSNPVVLRMCSCFDFCLQNKRHLFIDRHLDQIAMCCMYGVARVIEQASKELKFKQIIHAYKNLKHSCHAQQLVRTVKLEGSNYGTVIIFYNQVFVQDMKEYLCKNFQDPRQENSIDQSTPTRALNLHNVTLSSLKSHVSPFQSSPFQSSLTPITITHFRIDDSPIGSLRCVSKKDHVTENSSHVNKKLKFEG